MRKSIKILEIQRALGSDNSHSIAEKIASRRLRRLQNAFDADPDAQKWLIVEIGMHNLKVSSGDGSEMCDVLGDIISPRRPRIEDHPKYPRSICKQEQERVEAWLIDRRKKMRRPGHALPEKLPDAEKKEVREAAAEITAVYLTENDIDVIFSDIHADFPWLSPLTEKAWKQARRRALSGLPAGVGPMLLLGPAGIGKSSWARAVSDGLGVPRLDVDVGATGGAFDLQGTAKGWGGADKGRLMSTIISTRTANPFVILDEIDAGDRSMSTTKGSMPGLYKILMGLIEPSTAAGWVCPFYQVPIDLRHVSWIATCNMIRDVEQALLDRMTVIDLPDMTRDQLVAFASEQARARFGDDFADVVVDRVRDSLTRGYRLSLRHIVKMLDKVEDAINRPLQH